MLETPHRPVMHLATIVANSQGTVFAVLVLGFEARPFLARFAQAEVNGALTYLVSPQGDYALHPDPRRTLAPGWVNPTGTGAQNLKPWSRRDRSPPWPVGVGCASVSRARFSTAPCA